MIKNLWIDTDIGGDCDDAGALALANIAARDGTVNLLGMSFTTSAAAGPACMDAINNHYGNAHVPIGMTRRQNFCGENVSAFQDYVARHYDNRFYERQTDTFLPAQDALRTIRRGLAAAPDGSVTFVCIGQLNNASDLLDSPPDDLSPLSGVELVRQKVREFAVMGGLFLPEGETVRFCGEAYETEYNIATDIPSAENFIKKCSTKVVFCDFLVGYRVLTCGPLLQQRDLQNPVVAAYRIFQNRPRESWDPLTVYYAVYGTDDLFTVSGNGRVTVEPNGKTVFDETVAHDHYYLRLAASETKCAQVIDQMLLRGVCYEKKNENVHSLPAVGGGNGAAAVGL